MANVLPRQRVYQAIRHEQPDCVPWHLEYTVPAQQKLEAYYGTSDLDGVLGNHLAKYRLRLPDVPVEGQPGCWRDEFGVVWDRTVDKDIGVVRQHLLGQRSLDGMILPDPHDPRRFAELPAFIEANQNRFRYVSVSFSLFERAWILRGMSDLMIDMLQAPEFVDRLLDVLVQFDLAMLEEALRYDIDGVIFGDDWGHQRGLLFGARLWQRFIKPRIAVLYRAVKRAGKVVIIHSCGKVQELFPDLIEVGLDVFNPLQPEVMDPLEIKRQFGDRLSFFGGLSIQKVLPFGSPQDVRNEARRLAQHVGKGGGLILSPSHAMPGDIPVENIVAFVETMQKQ
jgi:uroporphyrinogen decarboxylase